MIVDDEDMVVGAIQGFLELETDHIVLPFTSPRAALRPPGGRTGARDRGGPHDARTRWREVSDDAGREVRPEATRILLTGYAEKENAILAIQRGGSLPVP